MILMNKEKALSLSDKLYQHFIERFEEFKDTGSSKLGNRTGSTTACNLAVIVLGQLLNQGGFKEIEFKELAKEFKKSAFKAVVLIGGGEPMVIQFGYLVVIF